MSLLEAISKYFETILPDKFTDDDIDAICSEAQALCRSDNEALNKGCCIVTGECRRCTEIPVRYDRVSLSEREAGQPYICPQ